MAIYLQWDVIISVFNVIIVLRLLTFRTQLDSFYTLSWNNEYHLEHAIYERELQYRHDWYKTRNVLHR